MPLKFTPENINELKNRYLFAIQDTWVPADEMEDTPGKHREHVFDCEDGIRLIISKDLTGGFLKNGTGKPIEEVIHFSGSVDKNLFKGIADETLLGKMVRRYGEISNTNPVVKLIAISERGIPHWAVLYELKHYSNSQLLKQE